MMEVISRGRWPFGPSVDDVPSSHLNVTMSDPSDGTCRVAAAGDLDLAGSGVLEFSLANVPGDVVLSIDLMDIEFIDCSGIRSLMELRNRRRASLVSPSEAVRRLFGLARVEHLLDVS